MQIIDIHNHMISPDHARYPIAPIGGVQSDWSATRPVSAEQLLAEMDAAGVAKAAVVQASTAYGHDNSYLADRVAAHAPRITGVFSVDPLSPSACADIERWTAAGLTGIRFFTTGSTMPDQAGWLDDPATFPVWELAEARNLPICLQMRPKGIPQLRTLLARFKHVPVLLDHMARPELSGGAPFAEAAWLFDLAPFSNVVLKLTTRTIEQSHSGACTPAAFFPLLVSKFGAERIGWGSNFPAHAGPLAHIVEEATLTLSVLSSADQEMIFSGTARRLYPALA